MTIPKCQKTPPASARALSYYVADDPEPPEPPQSGSSRNVLDPEHDSITPPYSDLGLANLALALPGSSDKIGRSATRLLGAGGGRWGGR